MAHALDRSSPATFAPPDGATPVADARPAMHEGGAPRFKDAADWWASLGEVPMERILFDPPPGTATEADVLRLDEKENRLCELVGGTLVEKAMGLEEGLIEANIIAVVDRFVRPRRLGRVGSASSMMKLVGSQIRLPDVSFFSTETLATWDGVQKVPRIRPDLAVEVISEKNTAKEMAIKLAEYFQAGTRLVWYVDPRTRTVDVYISITDVTRLTDADTLTGGDVLPGFAVGVGELFDVG